MELPKEDIDSKFVVLLALTSLTSRHPGLEARRVVLRKHFEEFDNVFKVSEEENRVVQAIPLGTRGGGKRMLFSTSWPAN